MMEKKQIQFTEVGINDKVPYIKTDVSKACRVGDNFAISFYQMDYQALAYVVTNQSSLKQEEIKLMPVAKVVMNYEMFIQLRNEINVIFEQFEKEKSFEVK